MPALKAPAGGILRIGAGNVYVGNPAPTKAVGIATAARPHSWGWSEGSKLPEHLQGRRGFDALVSFGSDDPRDANDCVMQVHKELDVVHFSMTQVCEDVKGSKVGHARVFSMIAYKAPMIAPRAVVCHVAIHPNWIGGFDGAGHPVVKQYLESMANLRLLLDFAKAMGWYVVVTGDFNSKQADKKPYETVYDVFRDFRLTVRTEGLDGVAWDRRLALDAWHTIPKSRTRSDHDHWTVADLRCKK